MDNLVAAQDIVAVVHNYNAASQIPNCTGESRAALKGSTVFGYSRKGAVRVK
jgi:hypothetical protein